jgi:hypothetical protein
MFKRWNLLYRWMGIFMVIFASGQSTASESTQQTNPIKIKRKNFGRYDQSCNLSLTFRYDRIMAD